jgi:putative acetyltransferase
VFANELRMMVLQSTMTSVTVRSVSLDDVPAVVKLVAQVLAEFGLEFGKGSPTDEELLRLPSSYADHGGAFWVAVDASGQIVGTCGAFPVEDADLEVRKMYLLPAARGTGAGRALLDVCVAWAKGRGARRLVLDTTERMQSAIAFYEKHGFVRDDRQMRASRCSRGYSRTL